LSHATRRLPIVILVVLGLSIAACAPTTPSASPSIAAPTTAPSAVVTASPAAPTATVAPSLTPTASAAAVSCDLKPQTGQLPTDRLTGMKISRLRGSDQVRFQFSPGSLTPAGAPVGSLDVATAPFTEGASGLPIELQGDHALQLVFRHMSLQNDAGEETYEGARESRSDDPSRSLRHVVMFDESEGQIGWYIGYDGSACVTLGREGADVIVSIAFATGS
jgi:hypothetical protein